MILTEPVQILDDKIKANKDQNELDREQLKYLHYQVVKWRNINI